MTENDLCREIAEETLDPTEADVAWKQMVAYLSTVVEKQQYLTNPVEN
jgi:hypothetical protein